MKQVSIQISCSLQISCFTELKITVSSKITTISLFMACMHRLQPQEIITFMVQDDKSIKIPSVSISVYHLLSTSMLSMDEHTEHGAK